MPKSKPQSGGKHRGKAHSYAAGGTVSDILAFAGGGVTKAPKKMPKPTSVRGGIATALYPGFKDAFDKTDFKPASSKDRTPTTRKPKPKRDHPEEAGFPEGFVSAQQRMRQPGDPADKGPKHKQKIVNISKEDRKYGLSAARKAGHLYYWKETGKTDDGKPKYTKMAAVTAKELKASGYTKLRDYMNRQLGKTRR